MNVPARQVRAEYGEHTITVYQAYSPQIAEPALAAGAFVPPFKRGRMTWIRPSFTWMLHRSGCGTKPGQERVLAIQIRRSGFAWALENGSLSAVDRRVHASTQAWQAEQRASPVRVQWDPERDERLRELPYRSIQVGLGGEAADRYVSEWITAIRDVTPLAHAVRDWIATGCPASDRPDFPAERPYPLSLLATARIGAS
ncbi:MAG: hypothetical protein QOJ50_1199 [Cryptosporangiaceae bacterium]|nr:hypothetical protein [Cryptosporangiaceae bacterium]